MSSRLTWSRSRTSSPSFAPSAATVCWSAWKRARPSSTAKRVLELLQQARETLCEKYDVKLEQPIVIEIFPQQKDFAVRTFGMPGVAGFLGVCFGRVITANSPASQGENPANWEAVLWHEFCHVVTLHKTHNKMPRWLSEGISVYEERQADPTWGQSMTPQYREIILERQDDAGQPAQLGVPRAAKSRCTCSSRITNRRWSSSI